MNFSYLVRCADGSLYAGWTNDVPKRLNAHNTGKGAKYTRARLPVALAYTQSHATQGEAMAGEAKLKRMTKAQKETLAAEWAAQNPPKPAEKAPGEPANPAPGLAAELEAIAAASYKVVFSLPKGDVFRKASVTRLENGWQAEKLSGTQAFHENFEDAELVPQMARLMQDFGQLTALAPGREIQLKLTKKGRLLKSSRPAARGAAPPAAHNRPKKTLLPPGVAIPALVDVGILSADGRPVAAKRDKLKQVNRFLELVDDVLDDDVPRPLNIIDFGCGKSALTFVLYHYLTEVRGIPARITGLDLKADVVAACNAAARRYGYENLQFSTGDIAHHTAAGPVHMVLTLHACDTATDLALAKATEWDVPLIFSVPCCQHELNAQMHSEALSILTRYGIIKERAAALMTDAVRANLLAACGYKTQLVEFVGFEHTPKNIMIRAKKAKTSPKTRQKALDEVLRLMDAFALDPALYRLLRAAGRLD